VRGTSERRSIHVLALGRIESALNGRPWSWLSEKSGVPQSTLSAQINRPKFTVDVLVAIADALEMSVADLLAPEGYDAGGQRELQQLLNRLEQLIRETRIGMQR